MAFIQRYSTIDKGGVRFIGNTLGLSKRSNQTASGTLGSIGAFSSLTNSQVATYPVGTTLNYLENGSNAILNLPVGSSILYAELIWGGLYKSQTQDISNLLNNSVILNINGVDNSISPDPTTAQTFLIPTANYELGFYVRTANVTSIVSAIINGTYSVSQVPALIIANDNQTSETNHAGWTLSVVFKNESEVLRNLTLWVGGAVVGPNNPVTDITLTGFLTPPALPITGKAFLSAGEGDAILTGDQFLFGKNIANLTAMSGPNNPLTNFFASQINNENGTIETSGTFGTRNANASAGTNISAGRQGWDITAIDISGKLETSQSSALFRFTSSGDLYVPNALATQIDSIGTNLEITKAVDNNIKAVGENINYTITVENTGEIDTTDVTIVDPIPSGLTLVSNTIYIDGVLQPDSFPLNLGTITSGQTKTVTYSLVANSVPLINPAVNVATTNFSFEPFEGYTVTTSSTSSPVSVTILSEQMNIIKTVDKQIAKKGDTLTYTSNVVNNGTLTVEDIVFTDSIPLGTTFIPNSVYVDGVQMPNENPENGVSLGTITPSQYKTVTFSVTVN